MKQNGIILLAKKIGICGMVFGLWATFVRRLQRLNEIREVQNAVAAALLEEQMFKILFLLPEVDGFQLLAERCFQFLHIIFDRPFSANRPFVQGRAT